MSEYDDRSPHDESAQPLGRVWQWVAWLAVLGGLAAAAALVWPARPSPTGFDGRPVGPRGGGSSNSRSPEPLLRSTRHQNTGSAARYVGTQSCVTCHQDEHSTFLATPHSQALGRMGDVTEPPAGSFVHARSTLTYSVQGQGADTRHRIVLTDEDGSTLVTCEFPLALHIGSGNHSRSYLLAHDDFLFESPITWYAARKDWGLSPGYDAALPLGFERIVDQGCLVCHAGRVQSRDDNRFRSTILEGTIGCESCHGPGSLHVERWQDRPRPAELAEEDLTIVNPARLSRDQAEQICSFCHLRGAATVAVRGRRLTDYRPGLPLDDFRVDYFQKRPDDAMRVTGHVEQMRRSKCYQQSNRLTCITCHDPHARPAPAQRVAHFRQKCLDCHEQSCGLAETTRLERQPADDCVACHMPRGDTDIPHFAFTHHRIGRHAASDSAPPASNTLEVPELIAGSPLDHLSRADQLRCLGLAYVEIAEKQPHPRTAAACRERAWQALHEAYDLGVNDALALATMAALAMERDQHVVAGDLATTALDHANLDTSAHSNARFVLARALLARGDLQGAQQHVEVIVRERWRVDDWLLLAEIRGRRRDHDGELAALLAAEQLNPFRLDVQRLLVQVLTRHGQTAEAEWHQRIEHRLVARLRSTR